MAQLKFEQVNYIPSPEANIIVPLRNTIIKTNTVMKNANQILSEKGYDYEEQNDIINFKTVYADNGLDMTVRTEFGLEEQPLHLWEAYYVGDADEKVLEATAAKFNYQDVNQLLHAMTCRLNELCEEVEQRS